MSTICHLGAWGENWGDRAIQYALQKAIGTEHEWRNVNIQERRLFEAWEYGKPDLLLIGGGGLLWDKPELQNKSGWQWDISVEEIEKLEMPVVVHSIGLTRFPYGDDTTGKKLEYWDTLEALLEKAELFSVRNDLTRDHLIEGGLDGSKITVCPDPALFLGEPGRIPGLVPFPNILGICLAWDKPDWRWPGRYGGAATLTEFMDVLGNVLEKLVDDGWELRPFCHLPHASYTYRLCLGALTAAGKPAELRCSDIWVPIRESTAGANVVRLAGSYTNCTTVISMRKHGLLIPAGLGVPVVGLGDLAEVGAICEQLGAECIRSEDASPEVFTSAILDATPFNQERMGLGYLDLRVAHDWHIAQIQDLLT